jgi:4-amino-4-deoxy-L-arabinose transferase-like glycosyltransferase
MHIDPVRSRRSWLWLLALGLILLAGNARTGLWDQDEAAYAGFGRTMIESGDWLVPSYTWSEVHRKPPLHFWGIAVSQSIFGQNEWATRLPATLAIFLCVWLLWQQASRLYGKETGRWAALIFGTSALAQAFSHISLTDSTLLLWQVLAALSLLRVLNDEPKAAWLFWLAIGLGALTKGPPIIIFTGAMGLMLLIFHPYRKKLFRLSFWLGLPLAFLPLLLWGWLAWQRDGGEFVNWLIDWYILKRVGGSVFGQSGPPGYHLVIMLLAFLPWLAVLPFAVKWFWRKVKKRRAQELEILAWLIAGWIPYELVSSKLPSYALAAHPGFAMMLAYGLSRWEPKTASGQFLADKKSAWLVGVMAFWLLVWAVFVPSFSSIKDSSLKVQAAVERHTEAGSPVLIGQSEAKPPSLPFYLEKKHPLSFTIKTDSMLRWQARFPEGLMVLNEHQFKQLGEKAVLLEKVVSRNSGKNVEIEYFVVRVE